MALVILAGFAVIGAIWLFLSRVPKSYPAAVHPLAPVWAGTPRTNYPAGFDSPYLGHTGSWDGRGGGMFGSSKINDLDAESRMGLRWTFMAVYWRELEPDGPVDLTLGVPPAWQELDAFVGEARKRDLNILLQAPVMGGNAGGPPAWAGRKTPRRSAPADLGAAAAFAGRLAARYAPGGTLAQREGWGSSYGVRAWEIDNEPDSYRTHWEDQAADYAMFVQQVSGSIKHADPLALILAPGIPVSRSSLVWINQALAAGSGASSTGGLRPAMDVVSFHIYEGLDSAFQGKDRDIELAIDELQAVFTASAGGEATGRLPPPREYWHTEGNFDFLGILSASRRAAWRMQFMTRAFAAGVSKVCVMDASPPEQIAVRTYVTALPNPFPMRRMSNQVEVLSGRATAFYHTDTSDPNAGGVWILWAEAGTGEARVNLPLVNSSVMIQRVDGTIQTLVPNQKHLAITLPGDAKMAPPVLLIDRAGGPVPAP